MMLRNELYTVVSSRMGDGEAEFVLRLDAASEIYKVHFPGNPITPGACLLQIAKELASDIAGREMYVRLIKNIKFIAPVIPGDGACITYSLVYTEDQGEYIYKIVVGNGNEVFAKQSLVMIPKEL